MCEKILNSLNLADILSLVQGIWLYYMVYKRVPANLMLGVTLRWTSVPSRGEVEILLVASRDRKRDKLRPGGPLGSYADLPLPLLSYYKVYY